MHSFIASSHMKLPPHQGVFPFLSQSPLPLPGQDPYAAVVLLTHSQMWRGQACYQENQKGQINKYVSEVDLTSFSFQYTPLGRIKIRLPFAFWEPAVARAVKATSSTAFLKTLSARQMVGQEGKGNLICHTGLHFWNREESESSLTGSLTDLPTQLRRWPRQGWHSKKYRSSCLPELLVLTNQGRNGFVTSLIYFSLRLKWKTLNCEEHCSHSDDEQHKCTSACIL